MDRGRATTEEEALVERFRQDLSHLSDEELHKEVVCCRLALDIIVRNAPQLRGKMYLKLQVVEETLRRRKEMGDAFISQFRSASQLW